MRKVGWEVLLDAYLRDVAEKEFAYGICDCVIFASDAVKIMTGIDPMLEGRDRYDDLKVGAALIAKHRGGYFGIMDFYFERHKNVRKAQRGDVVVRNIDGHPAFGIVWNGKAFFKGIERGLVSFPVVESGAAWVIG